MNKTFTERGFHDYLHWQNEDRKTLRRINALIKDVEANGPLVGIGKPEQLKYDLQGWYSRRIDEKNRLVYRISEDGSLEISQCKSHYE